MAENRHENGLEIAIASDFPQAVDIIIGTLAPSSIRVYRHTYSEWERFAAGEGFPSLELTHHRVNKFVNAPSGLSKSARKNRLSHIRRLMELLSLSGNPVAMRHYAAVKSFLKVRPQENDCAAPTRSKRALSKSELQSFLAVWADDDSDKGLRNNALIRTALYSGARRQELVGLRWDDIDLNECVLTIRNGKGGKERTVAIADETTGTCAALTALRRRIESKGLELDFVFPALTRGRSKHRLTGKTIHPFQVSTTVAKTAELAGLGHLSPHDLRRTNITQSLAKGAPIADVQDQAGHADGATTLLYAQAQSAVDRKARVSF